MNPSEEQLRQQLLDRLVDGELSDDERRDLLGSLDATPGAWRDCALAFLEAQSLRAQLGALADEAVRSDEAKPNSEPSIVTTNSDAAGRRSAVAWLAVAASLLVAFGAGTFVPGLMSPGAADPANELIAESPAPVQATEAVDPIEAPEPAPRLVDRGESVTFWVADNEGGRRKFSAPLVDAQELDKQYGLRFPSRVTPGLRQRFEGQGFHVSSRQRYAPLYLDNGRPLVVPVEDVKIVPVASVAL